MNSVLKGLLHTLVTIAAFVIPTALIQSHVADISIGTVVAWILNWLTSHTIATTSGVSSRQNSTL